MDQTEQEPDPTDPMEGTEPPEEDPGTKTIIVEPTVDEVVGGSAPETVNLVKTLSEEDQKKCAEKTIRDFERDQKSGQKWRDRHARVLQLALGDLPEPEDGDTNKARIHYAIIMKAAIRIQARIYDQQFPSNGEFFGVRPEDALDLERAVRVAKHLNWQVLHQIPEYVPNHDALIMQWLLYGSAFTYVYWDPIKNRPCHEVCNTEDIVLPYFVRKGKVEPSLADIPRISRVLRKYRHELEELEGYYENLDEIFEAQDANDMAGIGNQQVDQKVTGQVQKVVDKDAGQDKPTDETGGPRILIEQHCWYKLPNEDKQRPVVITVDYQSKALLKLTLREDKDPEDWSRYTREKDAIEAQYAVAMQKYAMDLVAYQRGLSALPAPMPGAHDVAGPPAPGEQTMTVPPMPGEMTPTQPMQQVPPMPPEQPPEPAPPKMIPINSFTHYVLIPNPEGIYGLGLGTLLEGPNIAADVMASQVVDAATLANAGFGLMARQTRSTRGEIRIEPGLIKEVDTNGQPIKDMFQMMNFPGPNPAMGQMIKDQQEEGDELSGAGDILSGEVGGSNETATTTQIRISQAMAAIGIWNKRYTRARTCEGEKFARLNSVFLGDQEFFYVVDPFHAQPINPENNGKTTIARMDYLEDTDITITADPRMASQPQRVQEAIQALQLIQSNPILAMNQPLGMAAFKNLFIAMDRPDLTAAMEQGFAGPPPGAPPPGGPQALPPGGPPPSPPPGGAAPGKQPRPKPQNPGPTVPGAGPQPENGPQMGQGS